VNFIILGDNNEPMINFFRTERKENVQWTFLVNGPGCRVGVKTYKL